MIGLNRLYVETTVRAALVEDIGSGDITTLLTVPDDLMTTATLTAKQEGIIAGQEIARQAFLLLDSEVVYEKLIWDGGRVSVGDTIGMIRGRARSILSAERIALNFLQRMSGISTITAKYVEQISGTSAKIIDTRKTTPGLRALEKYAVTVGGGYNHRFGLSDGILIKDNHIAAAGGIGAAISAAKKFAPHTLRIEIEVESLEQLTEAVEAGADIVMLDNMSLDDMQQAVAIADGRVLIEASGGVNLTTVARIAGTGVNLISVGALTHSPQALDISLNIND